MSGSQGLTAVDCAYTGSTFREVREAVFANPYYTVWAGPGKTVLPRHRVTLASVLAGFLPVGRRFPFLQAARRTVTSQADLRWGPDLQGVRRLLHPNGVCLTGRWEITKPTNYSGYFAEGSEGLLIARYSTCCTETRRGHMRSLSLVGKLYPTTDPNSPERVRPANFFTQQDIGGERTDYINDAELRNAPNTTIWRRGLGTPVLLLAGIVFNLTDKEITNRQLYQIAELGKPPSEPTRTPQFLRLLVDQNQPRIPGTALDFRDEVLAQIYDQGTPDAKRELIFDLDVSDDGSSKGPAFYQRRTIKNWTRIGRLVFNEAVASRNADFVVHFHHSAWRNDRNDPSSYSELPEAADAPRPPRQGAR